MYIPLFFCVPVLLLEFLFSININKKKWGVIYVPSPSKILALLDSKPAGFFVYGSNRILGQD